MIKGIFWGLVLLNGVIFTLIQLNVFEPAQKIDTPQPVNADQITILHDNNNPLPAEAAPLNPKPVLTSAASAVLASSSPVALPESASAVPELVKRACMEWGDFDSEELAAAKNALARFKLDAKTSEQTQGGNPSFWVYIPPQKDDAGITESVNELKALGINDFFVVRDNNQWKHAISLGVFKTEEMAQQLLNSLQNKGLKNAQLGKREKPGKTRLLISDLDEKMVAQVIDVKKQFKGSKLKRTTCMVPAATE